MIKQKNEIKDIKIPTTTPPVSDINVNTEGVNTKSTTEKKKDKTGTWLDWFELNLRNPGSLTEITEPINQFKPDAFEGLKLDYIRMSPLNNGVFHFNHAAILGTGNDKQQQTPPYTFVVGVQKANIGLTYRYADGNNSNVQGRYTLFDRFTIKSDCTLGKDISSSGVNGELEYKADSCTLSLKSGIDPSGVGLLVGMSILQAITKRVRMGYDMMVSEQQAGAMWSFLLRYKTKKKEYISSIT